MASSLEEKIEKLVQAQPKEASEALMDVIKLAGKLLRENGEDESGGPLFTQDEFNEFMDYALFGALLHKVTE